MEDRIGRREKTRFDVDVMGTIRTGSGSPLQTEITDLSENGCACRVSSLWLKPNMHISLRIGMLGPLESTIRWVDQKQIGLEFHRPVYGPVFEDLRDLIAVATKQQDRRSLTKNMVAMADVEAKNQMALGK